MLQILQMLNRLFEELQIGFGIFDKDTIKIYMI